MPAAAGGIGMAGIIRNSLTQEQALQKLRHFCGYQERCHQDAIEKLYNLGVKKLWHDEILATLIEENYLNEERYAIQFAAGHYRGKQWGRKKISYALKEKRISEYCISKALKQLDDTDYLNTLGILMQKKFELLKHEQYLVRKKKTIDYLLQKGFEYDLVIKALNNLTGK
jgi:regulatory protein